jgi:hypothetical protein
MPRHTTLSALLGLIITATPFGSQANDAFGVQPTLSIDTIATFAEQAPSMDDASPEQTIFDERLRAMHVIPASLEASYPDLYCHEVALNTAEAASIIRNASKVQSTYTLVRQTRGISR